MFLKQRAKQNVPYGRDNLNPGFAGLTAQLRFSISSSCAMESNLQAASCDSLVAKNAETCAVVLMNSTSFAACELLSPAATSCHNRPVTRNSFVLIRALRGSPLRFVPAGSHRPLAETERPQFAKRLVLKC